jgi:tetratricopeptide (TPR) repeat protein/predicted Ser/Thr protein kinase
LFQSLLGPEVDAAPGGGTSPGIWRVPGYDVGPEIGRGGSAVVYRAKQYDPERTVALKILLPIWTDGTGVRERFRLEAQALAQLDHPGILPVLASGEIDGVPWYSMPLAAGGTLSERKTNVHGQFRRIAEWLAGAAEAVAHAHARGVLHRDLKPGNLLFAEDGRLFVSDFGLARVLATSSNVTMTAAMLGTPAYMAPEVISNGIRAATVAADVWGLGAILYELLAGRRPFEAESIPELVRSVVGDEPPPLRAVPADLAAIAFRALHKNPERRYPTVLAMAADLRAWLAGEPVTARPYPWWERLQFATKRHPWAAGGIAVAILLSITTTLVGVRETRLRREEQAARLAANQEAETSREILKFLQNDLLAQASPESEPDRDIKLRTVLDRAAKTIDGRFPHQPLVEASIRETLASTYFALGEETISLAQAAKAVALYTQEKGPESSEILRLRYFEIDRDLQKGKLTEGEALATRVLAAQRRILPPAAPDIYTTWRELVAIYGQLGKLDQAEYQAREAWTAATKYLGPDDLQTIRLECSLADILGEEKRGTEALAAFRHCLAAARRKWGTESVFTVAIISDMAAVVYGQGDFAGSLALAREAVEIRTKILGPKHADTVVSTTNLASMLGNQGRLLEAEALFQQARATYIQLFGPEDQNTLYLEIDLTDIWLAQGRFREAADLGRKNLPVYERLEGADHTDLVWLKMGLARAYDGLGEFDHAIEVGEQCVDLAQRVYGTTSDYGLFPKIILAIGHCDAGHLETAKAMYTELHAAAATAKGDTARVVLGVNRLKSRLEFSEGKFAEAETSLQGVVGGCEQHYGATADTTLDCKLDLAVLLLRRNAAADAERLLDQIKLARERDAGLNAGPTLASLDAWGVAAGLQGRWPDAEASLRRSGEHWATFEPGGWRQALNKLYLGWVLYSSGQKAEAVSMLDAAYASVKDPTKLTPSERVLRSLVITRIADRFHEAGDVEASAKWQALVDQ